MSRLGISFQTDRPYQDYTELAKLVNRYDFETISVYDDLFYQTPWPSLFQLAQHTRRGILGPSVVNPYITHPVAVAASLALLDQFSGGRAYLGVGRGAFFGPIGLAQPRPLRAMREMVEMVQRLLTGDREPYQGEIFKADSQAYLHFDIPGRRVPVLVGTWGKKTAALAGEMADMMKVGGCFNAESAPVFRDYLRVGAEKVGRDPKTIRLIYGAVTVIDSDRKRAEELARRRAAMYIAVVGRLDPTYEPSADEITRIENAMRAGDVEGASRAISEESLRRFSCCGTPKDIVRQLEDLFDTGVDVFEFGCPHGWDEAEAIKMLGEEVLPAFK
jgi:5,10-methylenetetrahydromethanopterin reductase